MRGTSGRPQRQSLGAWLATLRPGDPCPWCGGPLKAASRPVSRGASTAGPGGSAGDGVALVCGRCGGEVDAGDVASTAGCTLLGHAA
jgi:hypothetical protein